MAYHVPCEEALTSEGAANTRGHITTRGRCRIEAEIMRLIEEGAVLVLPEATEIAYLRPRVP
jgi:hypothetical protein